MQPITRAVFTRPPLNFNHCCNWGHAQERGLQASTAAQTAGLSAASSALHSDRLRRGVSVQWAVWCIRTAVTAGSGKRDSLEKQMWSRGSKASGLQPPALERRVAGFKEGVGQAVTPCAPIRLCVLSLHFLRFLPEVLCPGRVHFWPKLPV